MDFSYSGITERLQGDKAEGKKLLIALSQEYVDYKERIAAQEQILMNMRANKGGIKIGIDNILKHLQLKTPLAITLDKEIIVITSEDVTFETNVL
jgi:hypothetical protein